MCGLYLCIHLHQVTCSHMLTKTLQCMAAGMPVRDPQQHVGQEWSPDKGTGYDLRAVTLLQLHD